MSSWDPEQFMCARSVTAWDHLPRGDTQDTWDFALIGNQGNKWLEPRRCIKCMVHQRQCAHQAPGCLSSLDLGKTQNPQPIWVCALAEHPRPEWLWPGQCTKCRAHLGVCPWRASWSLRRVETGSTHLLGLWQTQCGPSTARTPHTCQRYLFAVSLPLQNTTEKVSINKWPPSHPHVRGKIRHWWDLQTQEAEINKEGGTTPEVRGAKD